MLKLKKDVNLKVLENFGFTCSKVMQDKVLCEKYKYIGKGENNIIISEIDNKIIHYNQVSVYNELPDIIYDLIQSGMVEKYEI